MPWTGVITPTRGGPDPYQPNRPHAYQHAHQSPTHQHFYAKKQKVKFQDQDQEGEALVRFTVNIYWATQFHVRACVRACCVCVCVVWCLVGLALIPSQRACMRT